MLFRLGTLCTNFVYVLCIATFLLFTGAFSVTSGAQSLSDAVSVAIDSNPEIGETIENREAIEFELRQAKGLLLPSIDLEASVGKRRLDNPARRRLGIDDNDLDPSEVGVVATQKLFDFGRARAEIDRQASRVDSASFRVLERSEGVALQVVREYLEYMLQAEIVSKAAENLRTHRAIASDINSGFSRGALTRADKQQARERVLGAEAKLTEAEEDLAAARIRFFKLTGIPISSPRMPRSVASALPNSLDAAIGLARRNNPKISIVQADIDTADALLAAAKADRKPDIFLEGRARTGNDIDGTEGRTSDLQARVVLRWNLYRGGIKRANEQEHVRRVSEQRMILHSTFREVEEAVRISWDRRIRQARLAGTLAQQSSENGRLVSSYREQFSVGQRSLLDVLDAQNTRFNVDVLAKTAVYASRFAEYRLLASTGTLLDTLKLSAPKQSEAYARAEFNVPETQPAEVDKRTPSRQYNDLPMDILAPIRTD